MSVSIDQVRRKRYSINYYQSRMIDGSNLEHQFELLQEKVEELANYWKTEKAEEEISKYQQVVDELQFSYTISNAISSLKNLKVSAAQINRSDKRF